MKSSNKQSFFKKHNTEMWVLICSLAFVLIAAGIYFAFDHFNIGNTSKELTLVLEEVEYHEDHGEYVAKGYKIGHKDEKYTFAYHPSHDTTGAKIPQKFELVTITYNSRETEDGVIHALTYVPITLEDGTTADPHEGHNH